MSDKPGWNLDQLMTEIGDQYQEERLTTAWHSERNAVQMALRAVQKALPTERYTPLKVVGVGGSGIVLRLSDQKFPGVDRALKFPRPVDGKIGLLTEMLKKEIGFLSGLKHPGVVSIVDYAAIEDVETYGTLPFYVMDFVDGAPSRKYVRSPISDEAFHSVVRELAETLAYLHSGGVDRFAHLDLKAENIMVTGDGRPILIDLGTCKRLRDDGDKTTVPKAQQYHSAGLCLSGIPGSETFAPRT